MKSNISKYRKQLFRSLDRIDTIWLNPDLSYHNIITHCIEDNELNINKAFTIITGIEQGIVKYTRNNNEFTFWNIDTKEFI